jgi:FMN reductase
MMSRAIKIVAIVGNPKAGSRTLSVAQELARQAAAGAAAQGAAASIEAFDLAELGAALFDWESAVIDKILKTVQAADLLIVASPTYKATYTGLLKLFLDRVPYDGLLGVTALPVMVAAAPIHALAVELHLRPLLVELGASCPSRGLFVLESQLAELGPAIEKFLVNAMPVLASALRGSKKETA